MKKFLSWLFLPLILFSSCKSQNLEKSNLWEISGNGLEKPSYLFGTIHISCDVDIPERVSKAIDASEVVVMEVDMDDIDYSAIDPSDMMLPKGESIDDYFTADQATLVKDFFTNNSRMPYDIVKTMKPFFVQTTIMSSLLECPIDGVELTLIKKLKGEKEILGLETFDFQMSLFEEIPYAEQAEAILVMAQRGKEANKKDFKTLEDLYKSEDIEAMYTYTLSDPDVFLSDYAALLLDKRNQNWIPKIGKISSKQSAFYAVGAGHLAGEQGVINLLKKKGYTLTPIFD